MPHVPQQQNPPQSNIPHQTQVPIAHSPHNVPPPLNPLVNPPPVFQPQQLFNPQPPVLSSSLPPVLPSATTYLPVPHIPQPNIVQLPQARLVPCLTAPKPPLNCNLDLNLWRFPQNNPTNVNEATNNATVFSNIQPTVPPSTANPTSIHPILQIMHNKILIATTQITVASLLTPLVQLLTSRHLSSRRLYIQNTGILLRYHCAGVAHRIPRLQRLYLKMQA